MARTISAGELRDLITIKRPRYNEAGDRTTDQTIATGVRAKIGPTRGREEIRSARLSGISNYDVVVRSYSATRAITHSDYIVNDRDGTVYNVKWIGNIDEMNRFLTIICEVGGLTK